jgi:hypothetical protein
VIVTVAYACKLIQADTNGPLGRHEEPRLLLTISI